MSQRILITGGAGFLGSHLCDRMIDAGNEVICLDNYFTGRRQNITHLLDHPNFELIRHDIIDACIAKYPRAESAFFKGLMVNFCLKVGARAIIRGLRPMGDFEPEYQMGLANRDIAPNIETVFLIPRPTQQFISSSLIREIAHHGGQFERYVPEPVAKAMRARLADK